MSRFKVGDKVVCVENDLATKHINYGGSGWEEGKKFVIMKTTKWDDSIYWSNTFVNGVYEDYLQLVSEAPKHKQGNFTEGDSVRMKRNCSGIKKGDICILKYECQELRAFNVKGGWCHCESNWEKVEKQEGEIKMDLKKVIIENFEKTSDAVVVSAYLGNQITDNFISGLVIKDHKAGILAEAKRRAKIAQEICK